MIIFHKKIAFHLIDLRTHELILAVFSSIILLFFTLSSISKSSAISKLGLIIFHSSSSNCFHLFIFFNETASTFIQVVVTNLLMVFCWLH